MRRPVDAERIRRFMRALGDEADREVRLYFTGGATAVLLGWRPSTIDVDIKMEPEADRLFRALPRIKDKLEINIELAAPDQFIPELPGWQERSSFIAREGQGSRESERLCPLRESSLLSTGRARPFEGEAPPCGGEGFRLPHPSGRGKDLPAGERPLLEKL